MPACDGGGNIIHHDSVWWTLVHWYTLPSHIHLHPSMYFPFPVFFCTHSPDQHLCPGAPLDDLWQFSSSTSSWSLLSSSSLSKPGPRYGHFLVSSSSSSSMCFPPCNPSSPPFTSPVCPSFLHGGRVSTNILISDVWQLTQPSPGAWTWLLLSSSSSNRPSLSSLTLRANGASSPAPRPPTLPLIRLHSGFLAGTGSTGGSSIVWVFNPTSRSWYVAPRSKTLFSTLFLLIPPQVLRSRAPTLRHRLRLRHCASFPIL
jgi:hypothetical protein